MPQLTFTTAGQAEALAVQEAVAKKSRELKQEFEAGAKATKTWDENMGQLQRKSETALRSIQSEQEKIAKQIDAIQEAVDNGLYDGREEEAAEAIERLRQKWVDVDEATLAAKQKTADYERQQAQLKSSAEVALGSVQTEFEQIEQQIEAVKAAAAAGLIDETQAVKALERLETKLKALETEAKGVGARSFAALQKAFDPTQLVKVAVSWVGLRQAIDQFKAEIADLQTRIDKRAGSQLEYGKSSIDPVMLGALGQFAGGTPLGIAGQPGQPSEGELRAALRYLRLQGRRDVRSRGFRDLANIGPENELASQEIEQFVDLMRESGQADLVRKLELFSARLSGGTVSVEEEQAIYNELIKTIRARAEPHTYSMSGGESGFMPEGSQRTSPATRELTEGERKQIDILESMLAELRALSATGGIGQ